MRDKDLRRVAGLLYWHKTGKRAKATRNIKDEWALIRFIDYALPVLIEHGYVGADLPDNPELRDR